jgi:hypothetical protein
MERMTHGVKRCTFLLIPQSLGPQRELLAFSGTINDDGDYYFGDPLLPRIDEDLAPDMNEDGKNGIAGIDDDGDGSIDEWSGFFNGQNDDEGSAAADEDWLDGLDNDGDGSIDEDVPGDSNNDGAPGIKDMDDDGDGEVDEGSIYDDDEDGSLAEVGLIPVIYLFDSGTGTLSESIPYTGETVELANHVSLFQVRYEAPQRILIELTLTTDDGENIAFSEYVCPRNTLQKTGKRVR